MLFRVRTLEEVDLPEVLRIEAASFPDPWSRKRFERHLCRLTTRCLVAEDSYRRVRGYLVWDRGESWLQILNLAVEAEARRTRIGRALVQTVQSTLGGGFGRLGRPGCSSGSDGKKNKGADRIRVAVREENLAAQLFFRAAGFYALGVSHEADLTWIDFEYFPHGPRDGGDEGLAVLRSILDGDGRVVSPS